MPKSQRIRNVKSYLKRLFQRMHEQFTNDDQGQSLIILGPKWSYCMEFLMIYKESCTHNPYGGLTKVKSFQLSTFINPGPFICEAECETVSRDPHYYLWMHMANISFTTFAPCK